MTNFYKSIVLVIVALFLSGCQQEKENLSTYLDNVKARSKPNIEPMPVIKSYETFAYSAGELRNPFIATVVDIELPAEEQAKQKIDNGIRPDKTRLKEILESYPLTELRLVGTLEQESVWALIRAPEGVIHKVGTGDYIGQNEGQVLTISDAEIILKEIVSDGEGGYIERGASLTVIDVN